MIKNYSDHAASERTFLAWVRTAIAVMAFGFLIERFDLMLRLAVQATGRPIVIDHQASNIMGLIFIALGIGMIAVAANRYIKIAKKIDDEQIMRMHSSHLDLTFAGLLILLSVAVAMFLFRAYTIF